MFGITIAHIALSLWVPFKSIVVFVAVMMASPLDCIRSPLWLLPPGLAVLLMVVPSAVMMMLAPGPQVGVMARC